MAKSTRRRTKKVTRTPRQPKQPKSKDPEFLSAETHLRHNVLSMLHQHGQSVEVTIAEAKKALAFILDQHPLRAKVTMEQAEVPVEFKHVPTFEHTSIPMEHEPRRKHFDAEQITM